jgi:microcystin-dependent protein
MWVTGTAPTGWVLCDGTAYSRTVTYNTLFGVIGTNYGVGNGSTTFNVPNLKGKVPVGLDSTQTEFDALNETGGAKTHALTESEMPRHQHGASPAMIIGTGSGGIANYSPTGNNPQEGLNTTFTGGSGSVQSASNGVAHNNLQPYIVVNYIIKF